MHTVVGYIDHFNEISGLIAERQALENARDLNHEIAGQETGRSQRFLSPEYSQRADSEKKKAERRFRTALDLLLADPEYAKVYNDTKSALGNAEQDADDQIRMAMEALAEATTELETLEDRAAELPDGTKVFLDPQSGQVFTEDGRALSEEEAAQVEFIGNEPSYADYQAARGKADAAQDHLNSWYEYQLVLGGFRNELEDSDKPPSRERLDEIQEGIESHPVRLTGHENDARPEPQEQKSDSAFNVGVPDIGPTG